MQSTLFSLTQGAARTLSHEGFSDASDWEVDVAILHDPALHGPLADADLRGIDPSERALWVTERNRSALVFDRSATVEALLEEAAQAAGVRRPPAAHVFSLASAATADSLTFSHSPQPVRGLAVRPPAVAGAFYPREAERLAQMVDTFLGDEVPTAHYSAALVPHAGLVYSGRLAADVFRRIRFPKTVIVLGPKHTSLGMEWAVAPHKTWTIPGGTVSSDPELAQRLVETIPGLVLDAAAHEREHAIEVELPFLARRAPESRVVGIVLGGGELDDCLRFAQGLAQVVEAEPEPPLLVISSDMNHFATDAQTRVLDALALEALETLDPATLLETVRDNDISMCGVLPAVVVLETLRLLDRPRQVHRVGYATSADVSGDPSRVVGYAGVLFGG